MIRALERALCGGNIVWEKGGWKIQSSLFWSGSILIWDFWESKIVLFLHAFSYKYFILLLWQIQFGPIQKIVLKIWALKKKMSYKKQIR